MIDEFGRLVKTGGNVATYFTTTDGRVIHAVLGPVRAGELLEEARWAVELYRRVQADGGDPAAQVLLAHRQALEQESLRGGPATARRVHDFFTRHPLPLLEDVYREIFTRILGEALSSDPAEIRQARAAVALAGRKQLPILFILHGGRANRDVLDRWEALAANRESSGAGPLAQLAAGYVVVVLPISELPGLSQSLNVRPIAAPDRGLPVFAVARSDGRQLAAVTTWDRAGEPLAQAMALGLVQAAKEHPRSASQLQRLKGLVQPIDRTLAAEVRDLLAEGGLR